MKPNRFLGTLLLLLTPLSLAFSQDARIDYDHHANFVNFHTYYWQKVKNDNPVWESRIIQAVDQALQSKGWQRVDSGGEVALAAVGAMRNQQPYQNFYDGFGGWWGGLGDESTTAVENYSGDPVVVDMYDAQNKHLIWRGVASDSVPKKGEKNEENLDKAIDKMFKTFPPK